MRGGGVSQTPSILYHVKGVLNYGSKLIFVGITLVLIRMILPINFPFTYTILSTQFLPIIAKIAYYDFGTFKICIANIAFVLWIIVSIYKLLLLLIKQIRFKNSLTLFLVSDQSKFPFIFNMLKENQVEELQVALVPEKIAPAIVGVFKPILVLPDTVTLSQQEIQYICMHEIEHFKNHDLWFKLILEIVVCIHWWNPLVYLMRRALTLTMEISNDKVLCQQMPVLEKTVYAECVLKLAKMQSTKISNQMSLNFVWANPSNLKTRVSSILEESNTNNPRNKLAFSFHLTIISLVLFLSFIIVPEAYWTPKHIAEEAVDINKENTYLIKTESGYDIYVDNEFFGPIPSLLKEFEDYTIYEEGEKTIAK